MRRDEGGCFSTHHVRAIRQWKAAFQHASLQLVVELLFASRDGGVTMTRFLVVLIASVVAAACASVRSNIAVTHALPVVGAAKTIAIIPYTNNLAAPPDFNANPRSSPRSFDPKATTSSSATARPRPIISRSSSIRSTAVRR